MPLAQKHKFFNCLQCLLTLGKQRQQQKYDVTLNILTPPDHGEENKVELYKDDCHHDKVDGSRVNTGTDVRRFVGKVQVVSVH